MSNSIFPINISRLFLKVVPYFGLLVGLWIFWVNLLGACVPEDEGLLGQSAQRFLNGEIPHLDFEDPYTGLLTIIHSVVFKIAGLHNVNFRYFHFVILSLFSFILLRFLERQMFSSFSILIFILAWFSWSVLLYPGSMPSWYVTYLSFLSAIMLFENEKNSRVRLIFAGIFLGIACLLKVNSLVFVIASMWGVFLNCSEHESKLISFNRSVLVAFFFIFTNVLLLWLLRLSFDLTHLTYFFLPILVFTFKLARSFYPKLNIEKFIFQSTYLLIGLSIPIAVFAYYYYWVDGLWQLYIGVFKLPFERLNSNAKISPPSFALFMGTIYFFIRAFAYFEWKIVLRRYFVVQIIILFLALTYWDSRMLVRVFTLFLSCFPFLLLIQYGLANLGDIEKKKFYFWLSFSIFGTLIQYPYFDLVYIGYVLVFTLTAWSFLSMKENKGKVIFNELFSAVLVLLIMFGLPNVGEIKDLKSYIPSISSIYKYSYLNTDSETKYFCFKDDLVNFIKDKAGVGESILAFPDSPDIYFATQRFNLTRFMYDMSPDSSGHYLYYLDFLDKRDVKVVVLNNSPCCSAIPSLRLINILQSKYKNRLDLYHYQIYYDKIPS